MSVFQETTRLEDCLRVLEALAGTDHDNEEYLLHDRSREQHAQTIGKPYIRDRANGDWSKGRNDHGGPFVAAFLGRRREDGYNCLTGLPSIVRKVDEATSVELTSSRYTKFRVGEIKDYLIADIHWAMDYYDLRKSAAAEATLPETWRAKATKVYGKYAGTRKLRIVYRNGVFTVALLDPLRANIRGFGVYLEDIKAGEVSLSKAAAQALSTIGEQHCGGLPALTFWGKPLIIAGMFGFRSRIPKTEVSIPKTAWADLEKFAVVEG